MTVYDLARGLPAIADLRVLCRALAVLDVVLNPGSEDRRHRYDTAWAPGEELASMRDGAGNEYSIVFTAAGAYVRGFDHESPMSPYATDDEQPWPGVLDAVPEAFRDWAQDYYEMPIDLDVVRHVYTGQPLTASVVTALNSATTLAAVADRIAATGYPIG
ncbi:hypothetical protein [Amycolatopsis sp. cmx-4-68]|uniref:hypothetical protein n=1 Tax=Amycolatopsis sp. cmx-4-68 TaxID=2790938 RepID=UPI00397D3402